MLRDDRGYVSDFAFTLLALPIFLIVVGVFAFFVETYFIPELSKKGAENFERMMEAKREMLADLQNKRLFAPLADNGFDVGPMNFKEKIVSSVYPVPAKKQNESVVVGRIAFDDGSTTDVLYSCSEQSECEEAQKQFELIAQDYKDARNAFEARQRSIIFAPVPFFIPMIR